MMYKNEKTWYNRYAIVADNQRRIVEMSISVQSENTQNNRRIFLDSRSRRLGVSRRQHRRRRLALDGSRKNDIISGSTAKERSTHIFELPFAVGVNAQSFLRRAVKGADHYAARLPFCLIITGGKPSGLKLLILIVL